MDYLGLLCLGLFAGALGLIALRQFGTSGGWSNTLATAIPVILAACLVVALNRFRHSPGVAMFPIGLFLALLWGYVDLSVQRIDSTSRVQRLLGFGQLIATVVLSVAAFVAGIVIPLLAPHATAPANASGCTCDPQASGASQSKASGPQAMAPTARASAESSATGGSSVGSAGKI